MITEKQIEAAQVAWANAEANGEDLIDELWRTALEAADAAAWEPINTAPSGYWRRERKFGESYLVEEGIHPIIAAEPDDFDKSRSYMSMIYIMRKGPRTKKTVHNCYSTGEEIGGNPTHWRPLPTPPEVSK